MSGESGRKKERRRSPRRDEVSPPSIETYEIEARLERQIENFEKFDRWPAWKRLEELRGFFTYQAGELDSRANRLGVEYEGYPGLNFLYVIAQTLTFLNEKRGNAVHYERAYRDTVDIFTHDYLLQHRRPAVEVLFEKIVHEGRADKTRMDAFLKLVYDRYRPPVTRGENANTLRLDNSASELVFSRSMGTPTSLDTLSPYGEVIARAFSDSTDVRWSWLSSCCLELIETQLEMALNEQPTGKSGITKPESRGRERGRAVEQQGEQDDVGVARLFYRILYAAIGTRDLDLIERVASWFDSKIGEDQRVASAFRDQSRKCAHGYVEENIEIVMQVLRSAAEAGADVSEPVWGLELELPESPNSFNGQYTDMAGGFEMWETFLHNLGYTRLVKLLSSEFQTGQGGAWSYITELSRTHTDLLSKVQLPDQTDEELARSMIQDLNTTHEVTPEQMVQHDLFKAYKLDLLIRQIVHLISARKMLGGFGYDLNRLINDLRPEPSRAEAQQQSLPGAIGQAEYTEPVGSYAHLAMRLELLFQEGGAFGDWESIKAAFAEIQEIIERMNKKENFYLVAKNGDSFPANLNPELCSRGINSITFRETERPDFHRVEVIMSHIDNSGGVPKPESFTVYIDDKGVLYDLGKNQVALPLFLELPLRKLILKYLAFIRAGGALRSRHSTGAEAIATEGAGGGEEAEITQTKKRYRRSHWRRLGRKPNGDPKQPSVAQRNFANEKMRMSPGRDVTDERTMALRANGSIGDDEWVTFVKESGVVDSKKEPNQIRYREPKET